MLEESLCDAIISISVFCAALSVQHVFFLLADYSHTGCVAASAT